MFAVRLIQFIEAHADGLSEGVMNRLKKSERCQELFEKVPADELRRRAHEIYCNLADWLLTKTEAEIEERYVGIGARRARQGVAYSHLYWAMTTTKEYLWDYVQQEGLIEEPVELWGEVHLLHSLEQFFDRALYYAAVGYEIASGEESEHAVAGGHSRSARR